MSGPQARVLVLPSAAVDDLAPLLPGLRACRRAGIEIVVGAVAGAVGTAARAGFPVVDLDRGEDGELAARRTAFARAIAEPDGSAAAASTLAAVTDLLADATTALGRTLAPDVVMATLLQPTGPVVADVLGVPAVEYRTSLNGPEAGPSAASDVVLDLCPPGLPADATTGLVLGARPWDERGSGWGPRARCRVAVGIGVHGLVSRGAVRRLGAVLSACASRDVEVVLVGDPLPEGYAVDPRVRLLAPHHVPVGSALPHVDALVHAGDPTTILAALVHGVPQLVLSDVSADALAVAARGAGLTLPVGRGSPDPGLVTGALAAVLTDATARRAATEVAADIAALPGPEDVLVPLVQELAGLRRGLPDAA